jgi:signal transduction histidine kinase
MKISGRTPKSIRIPPSTKRDAILLPALFLFNCTSFSAWPYLGHVADKPWLLLVWLYGLVGLAPLIWRDSKPLTVFTSQCALTVAAWPIMQYYVPAVGIPVSLYSISVHCDKKVSLRALLASFIPVALSTTVAFRFYSAPTQQVSSFVQNAVFLVLATVGAWSGGRLTRANQRHVQYVRELELERAMTQEAVAKERRRIIRELHDIVSHAVTVIVLQAAGAAEVADINLARVKQSLGNIENMGKQAMAELRRLLGVLEASDPTDQPTDIGYGPQPGLADLVALLTRVRASGMPIAVHEEGTRSVLDPSVDLAVYRIAQEGMTNVLKHAGKNANPQLRLVWKADSLLIQIDNGTNLAEAHSGQALPVGRGLVGLIERAHAVGGSLHAGPHRGGGYRLTATLPFAASATHSTHTVSCASSQSRGD